MPKPRHGPRKNKKKKQLSDQALLFLRVAVLAEGHQKTIAGAYDLAVTSVHSRLSGKKMKPFWIATRTKMRRDDRLLTKRQYWWRNRLKLIGIDPLTLPVTDPLWPACHKRQRGALVREVTMELRAEKKPPGKEFLETLCERVEARLALAEHERREAHLAACIRAGVLPDM